MAEDSYILRQTGAVIQEILDSIESQSADISSKADRTYVDAALANKVDKVNGKGLSSNDYSTSDRQKLASIEAGAQVNVPSDWNATIGAARILNKPDLSNFVSQQTIDAALAGKVDKVEGKGLSTNDYTAEDKTRVMSITPGAEANILESISIDGAAQEIIDKNVNLQTITNADIDALFT